MKFDKEIYLLEYMNSERKEILCYIIQLFEKQHFISQQMQSLLTNTFQIQQNSNRFSESSLFYGPQQQNANFYHYVHISPNSPYPQPPPKTQLFNKSAIFQSNISSQSKRNSQTYCGQVSDGFEDQFSAYDHQQKICCLLDVIRIYRKLVAEHGLFLLTEQHLKIDCIGRAMVFISHDIRSSQPSLPLNSNKYNELKVVQQFINLFRKYFSDLFFKYAKIRNFEELENFFILVKKRNQIHKRCKHIVRKMSRSNIKSSMSIKNHYQDLNASKKFDLEQRPFSYFNPYPPKSNLSISMSSNHFQSVVGKRGDRRKQSIQTYRKSEDDTNISSSILRQNKSYMDVQNCLKVVDTQRKSCLVKPTQEEAILFNSTKKSFIATKSKEYQDEFTKFLQKENQQEAATSQVVEKQQPAQQMKNQLQIKFENLFLSEIAQDCENQVLNSGNTESLSQFYKDFEHVFY